MRRTYWTVAAIAMTVTSTVALAITTAATWTGKLAGKENEKIMGEATMKPSADGAGTEVSVMLMGDSASASRPWHVHVGSCATGGGVFGGGKSYTPITSDASGHGMSKATLAVTTPDTGSYFVNVHESAANMGKIVACGDLTKGM
jgi:superoxide dismutase, Cu-Zn family